MAPADARQFRAHSSAGERSLHTGEVQGSIPCASTIKARTPFRPAFLKRVGRDQMMQQPEIYLDDKHWREFTSTHWLVFLDGASGSGKSTFKNLLLADEELGFSYAKRYTTRAPRIDAAENDDYIFVPIAWRRRVRMEIGRHCDWASDSDHCPLTVEVSLAQ